MPAIHFPLRWESTGDQWWYASPIDYAAANGQYELVRELLRIDSNHLFKLTSLRRIRRLETVWDDEVQFDNVAKCRAQVARKLLSECEPKGPGKNSLIQAGYGGWLMYTAASAGDLSFVQELLERNPLLVFGEGEFGVTDIFYVAARSKSCEVFRLLFDFAVSPRFSKGKGEGFEEGIGDIPSVYKWEMTNRAVHAAARGGNLIILKELLANCSDVLGFRDIQGSTILHAAAGKGQVEVIKYLVTSFDMVNTTDHHGNTALHIAAYKGQSRSVEALIALSPLSISLRNNFGDTFLHKAISGCQTTAFHRMDRQIELLKHLVRMEILNSEDVINAKNNEGKTALHMASLGNVHNDLVQLLMTSRSINLNARDSDGMTPLDYLKRQPHSTSSNILIRRLISAGGIFGSSSDYTTRKALASRLKLQANDGNSPGTSFRISDTEIFSYRGMEIAHPRGSSGIMSSSSAQMSPTNENKKPGNSVNSAAQMLKNIFHWPRMKKVPVDHQLDETPAPLRERFSNSATSSSVPNNKRTSVVRSNGSSPPAKKKPQASGLMHGVIQVIPNITVPKRGRSSSFSKSSLSSPNSVDKQKGICYMDPNDTAGPSCSNNQTMFDVETSKGAKRRSSHKRLRSQYFCFGGRGLNDETEIERQQYVDQIYNQPSAISVA